MRSSVDFPEPFGPGERRELAGAHREAHVVEHRLGAVGERHVASAVEHGTGRAGVGPGLARN